MSSNTPWDAEACPRLRLLCGDLFPVLGASGENCTAGEAGGGGVTGRCTRSPVAASDALRAPAPSLAARRRRRERREPAPAAGSAVGLAAWLFSASRTAHLPVPARGGARFGGLGAACAPDVLFERLCGFLLAGGISAKHIDQHHIAAKVSDGRAARGQTRFQCRGRCSAHLFGAGKGTSAVSTTAAPRPRWITSLRFLANRAQTASTGSIMRVMGVEVGA